MNLRHNMNSHKKKPSSLILPPKGVLRKRCSENVQQIYRITPMPKCDFNKVAWQLKLKNFAANFQNTFSREHL